LERSSSAVGGLSVQDTLTPARDLRCICRGHERFFIYDSKLSVTVLRSEGTGKCAQRSMYGFKAALPPFVENTYAYTLSFKFSVPIVPVSKTHFYLGDETAKIQKLALKVNASLLQINTNQFLLVLAFAFFMAMSGGTSVKRVKTANRGAE